jgi:hypothetical protein
MLRLLYVVAVGALVSSAPVNEDDDMVVKKLHISGPQNDVAEIVLGSAGDAYRCVERLSSAAVGVGVG